MIKWIGEVGVPDKSFYVEASESNKELIIELEAVNGKRYKFFSESGEIIKNKIPGKGIKSY